MPTEITYPGVYVQEVATGARPIEGVTTSVTAFVGTARKGSLKKATHIRSVSNFERMFGAVQSKSELGYAVSQFFLNGGTDAWVARVPPNATAEMIERALRQFDKVNVINLLVLPGVSDPQLLALAEAYCQTRRAFLITDSPPTAKTPADMVQAKQSGALLKSPNAAVYYPWLKIQDPLTNKPRVTPPSGTIAGLFARTDSTHGVWKAPAGTEATLVGVEGFDYDVNAIDSTMLNAKAVNSFRIFPAGGPVAWIARTSVGDAAAASEWKYIPVRRLALFLEESIDRGTQWVVFEPNDERLWAELRRTITNFLQALWRQGALVGAKADEAFFVKCDRETMTQADIDTGMVNVLIGFAPLKPAEFVIIRVQQKAAAQ